MRLHNITFYPKENFVKVILHEDGRKFIKICNVKIFDNDIYKDTKEISQHPSIRIPIEHVLSITTNGKGVPTKIKYLDEDNLITMYPDDISLFKYPKFLDIIKYLKDRYVY